MRTLLKLFVQDKFVRQLSLLSKLACRRIRHPEQYSVVEVTVYTGYCDDGLLQLSLTSPDITVVEQISAY